MLFLLNKTNHDAFRLIGLLGGDEDKAVLLVGDGVYYGIPSMIEHFNHLEVEEIYAEKDAVEERNINLSPKAEVVDYDRVAALIMDEYDKVLSL
ncbi:MAG: hypothetical protein JW882_17065 [Deltaproteobacteria bacterium]|nr:hypothetical protein [Deltaproteobacteria bacterium]